MYYSGCIRTRSLFMSTQGLVTRPDLVRPDPIRPDPIRSDRIPLFFNSVSNELRQSSDEIRLTDLYVFFPNLGKKLPHPLSVCPWLQRRSRSRWGKNSRIWPLEAFKAESDHFWRLLHKCHFSDLHQIQPPCEAWGWSFSFRLSHRWPRNGLLILFSFLVPSCISAELPNALFTELLSILHGSQHFSEVPPLNNKNYDK